MKLIDKFKQHFFKNNEDKKMTNEINDILNNIEEAVEEVDYNKYVDPVIVNEDKEKTILLVDDISDTWLLYSIDFIKIRNLKKKDPLNDFKIIKCFGEKAGFTAIKYLNSHDSVKIDYAILDITLGYGIKLKNGEFVEYDGIDIAIKLIEKYPDIKLIFSTAHTLNRRNPVMKYYFDKFEQKTKLNILDYYMLKSSERYEQIYNLLYKDMYGT